MANKIRKFRVAAGTLTLPTDVSTADDIIIEDVQEEATIARQRLNKFLNLLSVQGVVVAAVVLDILLVTFLLLMELNIIQAPPGDQTRNLMRRSMNSSRTESTENPVQEAEHIMHIVELVILTVFLIEIILRVLARGVDLVYDKWQVFDCLVVIVTFALYVSLTAAVTSRRVTYSVGYLIVPRLWRIGRIHYDLTQPVIQKARSLILAHRRAWRESEEQLKQTRQRSERQQQKIEVLQAKLRVLELRSRPLHSPTFSADTLTSDDDTTIQSGVPTEPVIPAEVYPESPSSFRNIRSRSLPSTTPNEYFERDSSMSLPGTPKSLSCCHSNQDKLMYGSSGRIPDLVEHTQGADICRHTSFKEALALQVLALDSGSRHKVVDGRVPHSRTSASADSSPHKSATQATVTKGHSKSDDMLQNSNASKQTVGEGFLGVNGGPKYRKNPDRGSSERTLSVHHREKSASTGALAAPLTPASAIGESSHINSQQGELQSTTLPRIHKEQATSCHDSKHYPRHKDDRSQLLTVSDDAQFGSHNRSSTDFAFSNPSFTDCLSPEEQDRIEREEIERVSQIPFDQYGSISHLLREGIPISEL